MNVINDAYFNEKDQKLWKTGEQQLRISSVEQVKEMIPDMFVARNKTSKEITGVVVAKIFIEAKINGGIIVEIGPLAVGKTFQVHVKHLSSRKKISKNIAFVSVFRSLKIVIFLSVQVCAE